MRILFATGQGGGHFGSLVPFGRAYERAGHEVLVAAARGLAAEALDEFGPHALRRRRPVLTCSPRSLDDGDSDVQRFRLPGVGERIDASLIYVSFGSEIRSPTPFRETASALADAPKRVLMTLGYHVDVSALGTLPPNVRVERWIPQGKIMPHAAAMVGHGGSGGTLQALAAGVPIAFLPLFVDGPASAARVSELGAGIVAAHAGQVVELLGDRTYQAVAERIADEIRALPPIEHAVDVLSRSG